MRFEGLKFKIAAVILTILLFGSVVLVVGFYSDAAQKARLAEEETIAADTKKEIQRVTAQDSFYQKIADGKDVNILIVGDSIGAGSGAGDYDTSWGGLMTAHIQDRYGVNVELTNISMGGNTSYAGYVRTMKLSDGIEYDLAVICYGENDAAEQFSTHYESIIRALRNKYEKCSVISVLESSQQSYNEKMTEIQRLDAYYQIPVADTIQPFMSGEYGAYDDLTVDGTHPNDTGHQIYADVINEIIDSQAEAYVPCDITDYEPVNAAVKNFDHFRWIDCEAFERDGLTFVLQSEETFHGIVGIDYHYVFGTNTCTFSVDGNIFGTLSVQFDYDLTQRHINMVNGFNSFSGNGLMIAFGSDAQAEGFNGICFSWGD